MPKKIQIKKTKYQPKTCKTKEGQKIQLTVTSHSL